MTESSQSDSDGMAHPERGDKRTPYGPGPYRYRLHFGHHNRAECLTRPGYWCFGIGPRTPDEANACKACPQRKHR